VPQTTVRANLLQPLQIIAQLGIDGVRHKLAVLAVHNVLLSVEEPGRDLELRRVLDDVHDALELVRVKVTSPLVEVDVGLLAHNVRVPTPDTLDLRQRVHDLPLAVNVCVQETKNVLELHVAIRRNKRHV